MKVHWGKTKVMRISKREDVCNMRVTGRDVEEVKHRKYLGVMMNAVGTCEDETENRIGAVARVIGAVRTEVLERRELRKETKMKVFNAMVVATLLYGCETWTVQKRHESRLQACEMHYLRRVEGLTKMDQVRNEVIRYMSQVSHGIPRICCVGFPRISTRQLADFCEPSAKSSQIISGNIAGYPQKHYWVSAETLLGIHGTSVCTC